ARCPPTKEDALSRVAELMAAAAARAELDVPVGARAEQMRAIATRLESAADELVPVAAAETNLTTERLGRELARTCLQLRLMADTVVEGACLEVSIDHRRLESGREVSPDIRRHLRAVGPVLVIAGGNFPFAFGMAGTDTASAIAGGCPVIVKAHSGHLEL